MNEISKLFKKNCLHVKSVEEIKDFFAKEPEIYNTFKSKWLILDPNYHKNIKYKIFHTIAAFPLFDNLDDLKIHINEFFVDSEGEVSPSKFVLLNKINTKLIETITSVTNMYPVKMTIVGRCELIRKNIYEYPKCTVCNNPVSWHNSCNLSTYCSKSCSDNSEMVKSKRKKTSENLYGYEHYSKTEEFKIRRKQTNLSNHGNENYTNRDKYKKTCINKYNVDNTLKIKDIKDKSKATMLNKHGVENYVEHPDFKFKSEQTCMKKYGVKNAAQSPEIYEKIKHSFYLTKQYKNTNLYYQGTYEFYFLELIDSINLLNNISVPTPVKYTLKKMSHTYNPDFQFKEKIIEIKSGWTYNKNGKDKLLEEKNNEKWNAVKAQGKEIIILIGKEEIKKYVNSLKFS